MTYLNGIAVLVLGLGDSGLAMARWCASQGARVRVWDSRDAAPQDRALAEELPQVERLSGVLNDDTLQGVQLLLKSPGLAPADPRIAPTLALAVQTGIPVQGELDLFARALADLKAERGYAPKVIAITGTNGKTTTTAMTAQLIEFADRRVAMAGNIGPTMLDTLAAALALEPASALDAVVGDGASNAGVASGVASNEAVAIGSVAGEEALPAQRAEAADVATSAGLATEPTDTESTAAAETADPVEPVPAPDAPADAADGLSIDNAHAGEQAAGVVGVRHAVSVPAGAEPASDTVDAVEVQIDLNAKALADGEERAADALPQAVPEAVLPPEEDMPTGGGPPPHLIPPPPPGPVFEHLPEVWVLELSSFQLDGMQGFEPSAATVLNVTQDHLDWHGSLAAYSAAKARVFGKSAVMIVNRDDAAVEAMVPAPLPGKGRFAKPIARAVVRFGLDAPKRPGDFGLLVENGIAWMVRALEADETIKRTRKGSVAEPEALIIQRLMPADALRVRGRHNAANALAALALATAVGCPLAPMLHGLREYAGEPHRVEFISAVNGVEAYDDSKGTNVGATVAALNGLGDDKAPSKLVVILGGDGKGQDFTPLATPVQRHARVVATIGRDAAVIEQALRYCGIHCQRHDTLEAATRWAFSRAQPGDAVLLSPACASLDMFRNYAHRAEVFVNEVRALAAEAGSLAL